ncbi:MAG: sugar phosphate isomerase/epimerase [Planctomycetia bacterium]|nr:sugar phosphate isomerase/epimerase [Planctomycetia bacterium]
MFTISAFADEISPDPVEQVELLSKCGVRYIELRSILKTNVLDLTDHQITELKSLLDSRGFALSAIGSPIGKVKIDSDFDTHLKRFERAIHLAQLFETANIRVFSFYPPGDAKDWNGVESHWEKEVFQRMHRLATRAEEAGLRLVHENEHRIYGDSPDRVVKLFEEVRSPSFKAVYDAANYVFCGYDPWEGWIRTKNLTAHFHIKDWKTGEEHGCLAGDGHGRWPEVIADAKGYVGYATMEPHLLGGGPTGGVTGPELFPIAIAAFRTILARSGAKEG